MLVPGRLRPTLRSIFALLFTTTALVSLAGCAKTHTLRVMTYNIHHGRGTDARGGAGDAMSHSVSGS